MKTFTRFVQLFFVFVLLINSSIYAQWTAYNDCSGTNSITNTTNILGVSGTGTLKNFDTGATLTGVTATFTSNGSPNLGTSNGAATNSGTDAYNIFNGNANLVGVVNYGSSSGWYIDLTISGLDPTKTYTFVTTANRADASYTARISRYTISDISAANNASSDGVTVISNESVSFCTGYNSVNGYVARWTGIQTGTDGDFTIRADYPSNYQAYGLSVFMLQEEASTGPNINTTGSLNMFHSEPGIPSAEQSYTVSGTNLTAEIILNAPADFEISTNSGSGFSSSLSLSPISGTVVSTPVYVRFNRATEGTSSGDITHTSTDASTRNVAVNGEAIVPPVGWTAYNDCASPLSSESNITSVGFSTTSPYNYTGDAILLDQATGKSTGVTANLVKSGTMQTTTAGDDTPEGTDAYSVFYPFTDMSGVNNGTASGWYMDLTFIGLNPTKKYTFVTSVARQGGTSTYDTRNSMFTISDLEGAANASSVGVTEVNNLSVWFNGGQNSEGRVARWTGIQPGADGDFKVRAEAQGTNVNGYGFSVFMLKEETSSPAINIMGSLTPFNIIPGSPSVEQSYSVSGSNLTENIVITAPADFLIKEDGGTYGSNVSLIPVDGTVASTIIYVQFNRATEGTSTGNIEHTSDGATTRNVPVSGTAEEVPNEITISVRVNQSTDDSEEDTDDGSIDIESSDLELIHDSSYNRDQIVGMRFQNVEIPAGANILSAYIEFETDETVNTNPCNLRILGQAADNPATFTENVNDISSRNQTSASVNWSPEDWPTVNVKHQTPDITSIAQEIVNRAGWTSGNAMVYLIEGTGQRVAESWDGEPEKCTASCNQLYTFRSPNYHIIGYSFK
ncbi:MAG: hypothetical protein IPF54_07470 [Draconibacterium sp.]|nr:hypothetical protein [Draconibacterium sp.]